MLKRLRQYPPVAILIFPIVINWLFMNRRSLWIDETLSYWAIHGSLSRVIDTSLSSYNHNPLYFVILWFFSGISGTAEWALRLPSVITVLLATAGVYELSQRFLKKEEAACAALLFASHTYISSAAVNARPYGFALLIVVLSMLAVVRWVESGRTRDYVLFIIATALIPYFQLTFAPAIIMPVIYFWLAPKKSGRATWRAFWIALACAALLDLPLLRQTLHIWSERATLSFATTPSRHDLFINIIRQAPLLGFCALSGAAAAVWFERFMNSRRFEYLAASLPVFYLLLYVLVSTVFAHTKELAPRALATGAWKALAAPLTWEMASNGKILVLLAALTAGQWLTMRVEPPTGRKQWMLILFASWTAVLPLFLFGVAVFSDAKIFSDRYYAAYAIGESCLLAWFLVGFRSKIVNAVFVGVAVAASIFAMRLPTEEVYLREKWNEAVQYINQINPDGEQEILLDTGFVESKDPRWLEEDALTRQLCAPVHYYGARGTVTLMPSEILNPPTLDYVNAVMDRLKKNPRPFLLVANKKDAAILEWMKTQLDPAFKPADQRQFGWVTVVPYKPAL